jgi:hypothetical protein
MTTPQTYPLNQFAPEYQQGFMQPPPEVVGYEDRPFEYVYSPPNGQLTANQLLNPDTLAIQTDADFWLGGWYVATATGNFQVQMQDSNGYQLQSGMINSAAISAQASKPTVISPSHPFPAGSKVQFVIQDLSGATNTIQLVLKGWKRFRVQKAA